ncbi:MAG: gamma-glutamyl kinase [Rhodobacteraceae bacterium]|nr:gamma-glutamyl kinase [Paracoccaceae bacterium]MBR9822190.1 gamma-glutamyl kinase [Paracoccaceae bacterium]
MLVFSKARLVFLSVPKTGTTAYESALAPLADIHVANPPELKHAPVYRYNRFFRPMLEKFIGEDLEVLAVVREPVSWLGSWYRFRQRPFMQGKANSTEGISFDAFVEAYCQGKRPGFANVGSQAKFLEPAGNGTAATKLFRYEDQQGLRSWLEARLETRIETARENVSPALPLTLSPEVEQKLRRKCVEEFALWDGIPADQTI